MNLLLALYQYFPYGGLQKDTLRFAAAAAARGHRVTLLTTRWEGSREVGFPLEILLTQPMRSWSNTGRMDEFAGHFQATLANGNYDVSLAMNRLPGADFYFAADSCMAEYLPKKHCCLTRWCVPRYRAILRQEKAVFGNDSTTRAFLISAAQREEFARHYGTPPERLIDLPPGIDTACLPPPAAEAAAIREKCRSELGLDSQTIMLLLGGTGFTRKGGDRALRALASLPNEWRQRCRFYIVGNNSSDEVNKCAAGLGLTSEQAVALPARPNISALLLAADLMIHPAREEGTGTVLVEALANHLPVLCTAACGFAPYVAAAGSPVTPEPFKQEALDAALLAALPRLSELRQQAAEYAATQDFTARADFAIRVMEESLL